MKVAHAFGLRVDHRIGRSFYVALCALSMHVWRIEHTREE
jgi:hypothetical protein